MQRLVLVSLALSACAGTDTPLEQAFCNVLGGTNTRSISAATDPASAPESAFGDTRVEITLQNDGQYVGVVAYTADEAGSFAFGLDQDVPLTLEDADGTEVPWDVTIEGAACTDLAVRHTATLQLDTYYLNFGPTTHEVVAMVAEESDDDL